MSKLELCVGLVIGLSLSTVWGTPTWQNGHNSNQFIAQLGQAAATCDVGQQNTREAQFSYSTKQKVEGILFPIMIYDYLNYHTLLQETMASCSEETVNGPPSCQEDTISGSSRYSNNESILERLYH